MCNKIYTCICTWIIVNIHYSVFTVGYKNEAEVNRERTAAIKKSLTQLEDDVKLCSNQSSLNRANTDRQVKCRKNCLFFIKRKITYNSWFHKIWVWPVCDIFFVCMYYARYSGTVSAVCCLSFLMIRISIFWFRCLRNSSWTCCVFPTYSLKTTNHVLMEHVAAMAAKLDLVKLKRKQKK